MRSTERVASLCVPGLGGGRRLESLASGHVDIFMLFYQQTARKPKNHWKQESWHQTGSNSKPHFSYPAPLHANRKLLPKSGDLG